MTHQVDPANGEHELRGWSSRDGSDLGEGRRLDAAARVPTCKVGLVSHGRGAADPAATSQFDYFRTYR